MAEVVGIMESTRENPLLQNMQYQDDDSHRAKQLYLRPCVSIDIYPVPQKDSDTCYAVEPN